MWTPQRLYAQNFEDLYLYRLFSDLDKGFYVDVGAWLPRADSVTAIFYDQGWRGINIEPVREVFDILSGERDRDINLCLAVVDVSGIQSVPILLASEDPVASGMHHLLPVDSYDSPRFPGRQAGLAMRDVPATTLREIVERYAPGEQINFLKLDVEGSEHKALVGLDLKSCAPFQRPQVILLEVTLPNTRLSAPHRDQCRDYLLDNSYKHLFHDGLNDYYCLADLYDCFKPRMLPPNVFDRPPIVASAMFDNADRLGFVSRECARLLEQLSIAHAKNEELEAALSAMRAECDDAAVDQAAVLEQERRVRRESEKSLAEAKATLNRVSSRVKQLVKR